MPAKPKLDPSDLYPIESPLSLCNIPHESEEDRARLARAICHWADECEASKWPRALQWYQNYAYVMGYPFMHFNYNGSTLNVTNLSSQMNNKSFVPRTVSNYLLRPFEGNVSIFTTSRPYPMVTPRSDRPEDEDAAKASGAILETLWEDPLRMQGA